MKKYIAVLLCMLLLLTGSAGAAVQGNTFSAGEPHTNTLDFRLWFETMSAKTGACTLSINKSIYDMLQAQTLLEYVSHDLNRIQQLTGAPLREHTVYVVKDLFVGIQRFDNRVYCRAEDIENGAYIQELIAAALGIEEPWKAHALYGIINEWEIDEEKLAEYYRSAEELDMLSLFAAYFTDEFYPEEYRALPAVTAASLGKYILDNHGFSALMQENCDSYRQEWLVHIGVEREYVDPYAGWFEGFRYQKSRQYPLIATSPKGSEFHLLPIYDMETPAEVRAMMHEAMSAPQELIENLRLDAPEYAEYLSKNFELPIKYYMEPDSDYSSYAAWSLREIHLGYPSSIIHETMHILTRITANSDRYYMDIWKAEGLAEYLTLKYRPSAGEREAYFRRLTKDNLRPSLFDTREDRELKALFRSVNEFYLERAPRPESAQELDMMLYTNMLARAMQLQPIEETDMSVSGVYGSMGGSTKIRKNMNALSYTEACSFSDFLIRTYSLEKFVDFCEGDAAFEKVYGMSYEEAMSQWNAELTGMILPINPSAPPAPIQSAAGDFIIADGVYTCPNDGSTLTVRATENEGYMVELSLYRLTLQEGSGAYADGVLTVSATDAAGGTMIWHIKKDGDILRAEVASSEWSLLPEGTVFEFEAE